MEPGTIVSNYRRIVAERDAEMSTLGKADLDGIAWRLRSWWRELTGEDSLHAIAFGVPDEP